MHDETRDPEIQALRPHWKPPTPSDSLDGRVLRSYHRGIRSRKRIRRFWVPVLAAVALAAVSGWIAGVRMKGNLAPANSGSAFVPVRQPQIIVVSQGERP
jgi:hypothetical protein